MFQRNRIYLVFKAFSGVFHKVAFSKEAAFPDLYYGALIVHGMVSGASSIAEATSIGSGCCKTRA